MLYKNLPPSKVHVVLFVRFFMDYVAALQMLFAGKWLNAKAVLNARCEFLKLRMSNRNKKQNTIRKPKTSYPTIISQRSIVFDFYLRGKLK